MGDAFALAAKDTRRNVLNRMSYALGRLIPVVVSRVQRVLARER